MAWCYTIPVWLTGRFRKAQRRWFPPGSVFVFTFGMNPFQVLSWSENNSRELRLYTQPDCSLHCTLCCCRYSCYSFCFSFFFMLPHSRSPTHTSCTIPERGYANNGNCRCRRPINRTWTPSSFTEVTSVEVFWISSELCWPSLHCRQKSHSLQALQKLDGRLFCWSFQLTEDYSRYCYIMLLINVLYFTM